MAKSTFLIPLVNTPQTFEILLSGVVYTLTSKWNDQPGAGWILDIADSNANPIVAGLPLVTGANILAGLDYLGIKGELYLANSGSDALAVPTLDNLGTDCNLYYVTSFPDG